MATLEVLPEKLFLRYPDGTLHGPMTRQELELATSQGSISIFCWVYDEEKRATAPLNSFPDLYKNHPESGFVNQYLPEPKLLTLSYYFSIISVLTISCFGIVPVIFGISGLTLLVIFYVRNRSVLSTYNKLQVALAITLNGIGILVGGMVLGSLINRLLGG